MNSLNTIRRNGIAATVIANLTPTTQNGVVERRNRIVLSTTRSMMKAMKLPLNFWAEAVRHAIYILNRVPTRALEDRTPYEALYNRKPNLENLRIFGCTAYQSFVVEGVDNENAAPVNIEINDNIDNPYQEQDPINDPNSPITPSPYNYNPHSEEEATTKEEPCNYKEASTDKKWIEAMEIELDSINKNNTWTLTTLPPDQKAIGLKWVFKTKRDADGKIIKYKARLVAKAYVQEQGIDFDEVFAPVARIETVRLILALAAYHGWQVHHLDVKSAFLHGDLKEEVYKLNWKSQILTTYKTRSYVLAVGLLSRFMQDPKEIHLKAVKQVIRYIKGTKEHGIIYKKEGGCKITGYSDSSYGINIDQGKGTTGIVFYFGESPITWCTQKQQTVALSSCESEFMAATAAAYQALWLKRLLSELTGWEEERITLKVDNVSAIALVRNPVFHGRSKHIDIRYHFIRECVENGHINVEHVSGELQRADILTKALPRLKFVTMRQMLGVQDLGRSNDQD
ncbi:zinc finger, CCHC-type containing protein [Tanacetum coccineum]